MNSLGTISVICPIYNTAPYLSRCIDSVLDQSYGDFELVLVDDCSNDGSGELCAGYQKADPRIRLISHKTNSGVSGARNTGLRNARGEYIAWVDSDDWVDRDWLEALAGLTAGYNADISIIGTRNIYDRNNGGGKTDNALPRSDTMGPPLGDHHVLEFGPEEGLANLIDQKYINNGMMDKLFKKELFSGLSFPAGRKFEDLAVMHSLVGRAKKIVFCGAKKYNYFYRLGSITHRYSINTEYQRFLADRDRLDFFSSRGNRGLYSKELAVTVLDALKVREMGLFRHKTREETSVIAHVSSWLREAIDPEKTYPAQTASVPGELIKRFGLVNGKPTAKLYAFLRYGLKPRLRYFVLSRLPGKIVSLIRDLKRL